jgi:DNA-binding ferritin-like protein
MKKFTDFRFEKTKLIKEDAEAPIDMAMQAPVAPPAPEMPQVQQSEPAKFLSKMFESREMAHVYHLQITGDGSYAGHKALDEYYSGILDLIDELVETYQGQYNIIEHYDVINTDGTKTLDKIQYFVELAEFIKSTRKVAFLEEDSHLQNIIDEMVGLIYRTLYKLKNLK